MEKYYIVRCEFLNETVCYGVDEQTYIFGIYSDREQAQEACQKLITDIKDGKYKQELNDIFHTFHDSYDLFHSNDGDDNVLYDNIHYDEQTDCLVVPLETDPWGITICFDVTSVENGTFNFFSSAGYME